MLLAGDSEATVGDRTRESGLPRAGDYIQSRGHT